MGSGFESWIGDLLRGIGVTVLVTIVGALCALVLSFVLGLLSRVDSVIVRAPTRVVIELFRGTSLLVQLWWLYYVLPQFGYQLDAFTVAVIANGLNSGAYGAEVVRGAINAVPRHQYEAAIALNLNTYQRMRRVILPQAIVGMIPPFGNLLVQLLKGTPLVFTITLVDITAVTQSYRDAEGNEAFVFSLSLVLYFVIAYALKLVMNLLERRAKAGIGELPAGRRRLFGLGRPPVKGELG